jgi:hypothetical protein
LLVMLLPVMSRVPVFRIPPPLPTNSEIDELPLITQSCSCIDPPFHNPPPAPA